MSSVSLTSNILSLDGKVLARLHPHPTTQDKDRMKTWRQRWHKMGDTSHSLYLKQKCLFGHKVLYFLFHIQLSLHIDLHQILHMYFSFNYLILLTYAKHLLQFNLLDWFFGPPSTNFSKFFNSGYHLKQQKVPLRICLSLLFHDM